MSYSSNNNSIFFKAKTFYLYMKVKGSLYEKFGTGIKLVVERIGISVRLMKLLDCKACRSQFTSAFFHQYACVMLECALIFK